MKKKLPAGLIQQNGKLKNKSQSEGFTLIETIIALALVTVVFVSLAQLFTLSIMQNLRSNEMSNAIFLAQQQIDHLRTLNAMELNSLGQTIDEIIDINGDGTDDFVRITKIEGATGAIMGAGFDILVMVFPITARDVAAEDLLKDPEKYKVRARVHTIISR